MLHVLEGMALCPPVRSFLLHIALGSVLPPPHRPSSSAPCGSTSRSVPCETTSALAQGAPLAWSDIVSHCRRTQPPVANRRDHYGGRGSTPQALHATPLVWSSLLPGLGWLVWPSVCATNARAWGLVHAAVTVRVVQALLK
jgi:hypothetical protein